MVRQLALLLEAFPERIHSQHLKTKHPSSSGSRSIYHQKRSTGQLALSATPQYSTRLSHGCRSITNSIGLTIALSPNIDHPKDLFRTCTDPMHYRVTHQNPTLRKENRKVKSQPLSETSSCRQMSSQPTSSVVVGVSEWRAVGSPLPDLLLRCTIGNDSDPDFL